MLLKIIRAAPVIPSTLASPFFFDKYYVKKTLSFSQELLPDFSDMDL